jgi:acyl carrier protein
MRIEAGRCPLDSIEQQVTTIVSKITRIPETKLTPSTDLKTELNVDSLQGLQIVAALENHFGINIPDDELDMYTSIRSIVETIKRSQPNT